MFANPTRAGVAAALLAAIVVVPPLQGQAPDTYETYRAAVAAYAKSGDISRSVVPLQDWWSGTQFDAAVKATLASGNADAIEDAAIFQLEIGVALVGISTGVAAGHIRYGTDLLYEVPPR